MTDSIEGDWQMLVDEEPLGPDNRIYTFREGTVLKAQGEIQGSYSESAGGGYRIVIGGSVCSVRASGTIETLAGEINHGGWSDPVVFFRIRYDIRSPDSLG